MFQAGFARIDITPPLGTPVAGYGYKRISDHILDPLELNCVAFSDGENKGILISADVLQISESLATKIRGMIAKRLDIPADHVYLQALHQHTSIRVEIRAAGAGPDPAYLDVLFRKFCDVAQMALADLRDVELFISEGQTSEEISFIRRYKLKDGSYKTNPGRGKSAVVDHPLGEADNTVRLLRFKREGGDIALVNFHCHPDVIGGTGFSADWPGFVRRYTEAALPGVKCILVGGPQGDSNHINVFREKEEEEKRRGLSHSSFMGKTISDVVVSLWDKTQPLETGKVWGNVELIYVPTNMDGYERIEECKTRIKEIDLGLSEPFKNSTDRAETRRIAGFPDELLYQRVPVSVLCIGGAGFVGFGGEPFTKYIKMVREKGGDMLMFTACQCNGGQGYLPTAEAQGQGGYEARSSRFDPCLEKQLTDCTEKNLNQYKSL